MVSVPTVTLPAASFARPCPGAARSGVQGAWKPPPNGRMCAKSRLRLRDFARFLPC